MNAKPRHVERALQEPVEIVPYDPGWPALFAAEAEHLRALLPAVLIGRIEHFGSTAVPGLAAKPIIDMLVEVRTMEDVAQHIAPLLQAQGYGIPKVPRLPSREDAVRQFAMAAHMKWNSARGEG